IMAIGWAFLVASLFLDGFPFDLSPSFMNGRAIACMVLLYQCLFVLIFWAVVIPVYINIIGQLRQPLPDDLVVAEKARKRLLRMYASVWLLIGPLFITSP